MSNVRPFGSLRNVPIVGQPPVIIHDFRPVIVAQCTCGHGLPFLLTGFGETRRCDACENVFTIQAVSFDRARAEASAAVIKLDRPIVVPAGVPQPPGA